MDGLITLFLIIMFFVKLFGKSKKKSGAAPKTVKVSGFDQKMEQLEKWFSEQEAANASSEAVRAVDRKAELKAKYGEKLRQQKQNVQEVSYEGISRPLPPSEGVSHPLAPSEELTAGRASGSIAFHSDEGQDVCDPTLLHGESGLEMPASPVFQPHAENEPFLSADDLVRGFVVSEILARPNANRYTRMR